VPDDVERLQAEVIVVGMGPGGQSLAERLADAGVDVIGVDGGLVGGECPYWGCVPSKMMIRAANALAEARRVPVLAGASTVVPDWALVASRIREEATDDWDDRAAVERFEGKGGRFARGWARIEGPREVRVGDHLLSATRGVVLNPGTHPWTAPVPGLAGLPYWTNHEAIEADVLPESLIVLGGGAIGLELAQVFGRFGVAVTVVEAGPRLLGPEEPESSALVASVFGVEGIGVRTGAQIEQVRYDGGRFTVELASEVLRAERLLVATGRRVDLEALGVTSIGVDPGARAIPVDDRLRVGEGVWAIGDVTGKGAFTHVSMYQSDIVYRDLMGLGGPGADYRALPRVTFTDPEIGAVGLTEHQAREQGVDVATGHTDLPESTRGWIHKVGNEGFVKLVADRQAGILVGATSAGPSGGEVLGLLSLAVHARVPVFELAHMLYAYPTFHRAIEAAVADLGPLG
jgi:pyruvate/2-oxoglutarate dehydrogenase complex dihydrolipoamide dehydrogenase (E3) component